MKVFRDPVHNIIGFNKVEEKLLLDLINSKEMQRLRRIRQLGLGSITYPGAEHSRFVHSLGVAYLTKRIIRQLNITRDEQEQEWLRNINDNEMLALCAALLHDVGHGPFSHAIEKTTGIDHEKWTSLMINSKMTEINSILESYRSGFAREVADVIARIHPSDAVVKLLSSQLDADRIDYLLRDSMMTGAGYGRFDLEWLINVMTIGAVSNKPEVGLQLDKGLSIAEDFVMARYYMYQNVYFHKATRSAELIVSKIFHRVKTLVESDSIDYPEQFKAVLSGKLECKDEDLAIYLDLNDSTMWYWFAIWAKAEDKLLADLCDRILNRRLLKSIPIPEISLTELFSKSKDLKRKAIEKLGESYDDLVEFDNPNTSSYKDNYLSIPAGAGTDDEEASEQIILFDQNKEPRELASHSEIINMIRNRRILINRLYFPEELRQDVSGIFE